ncbi:MAG TPA: alpha/beta fold hydrolase [Streptosporangiaceae bacterium]|nr:alpha/beta fold hydrolase [Streptosporangiaceae bacterium]
MKTISIARLRTRRAALVAALITTALAYPLGHIPASNAATSATTGPKPTIVLVHGAFADGSSWDAVVSRLQQDGYTVDVPPNPLEGLSYDSATVRDFPHTIQGPVILIGHSYGGSVITNAATGDPEVKALVYVDALAPNQGQTMAQLLSRSAPPPSPSHPACLPGRQSRPGRSSVPPITRSRPPSSSR